MSAVSVGILVALLILAKWAAQLWLERLNSRHVLAHAGAVPEAFKGVVDEATYAKSVRYTLAKGRLDQIEVTYNSAVLLLVLFSGVLPWGFHGFQPMAGRLGLGDGRLPVRHGGGVVAAGSAAGLV